MPNETETEAENESQESVLMSAFLSSLQTMKDAEKVINSLKRIMKCKDQEIAELRKHCRTGYPGLTPDR